MVVWGIVVLFMLFGYLSGGSMSPLVATATFLILLLTITVAASGVVGEADELAHKLGEPYGTLILTLSILSIEVILISAVMLGSGENPTIGKDSIFSVMMIIMNLVIGLCILLGGLKYGEQEYNAPGTMSYIGMIIILGGIGLMLPNFITGAGNGMFSNTQAIVLSALIILSYGFFLLLQLKGYRNLYIQPKTGSMENPYNESLVQNMSPRSIVGYGIKTANLPPLLGGVLIATIVFTPESMTAVKAALNNEFQRAINLCHGAFVATVGLTVPLVIILGLITGKSVLFGVTSTETLLFILTLLLSLTTFSGKRTTPMVGIMHLVLFAIFIMLIFNP